MAAIDINNKDNYLVWINKLSGLCKGLWQGQGTPREGTPTVLPQLPTKPQGFEGHLSNDLVGVLRQHLHRQTGLVLPQGFRAEPDHQRAISPWCHATYTKGSNKPVTLCETNHYTTCTWTLCINFQALAPNMFLNDWKKESIQGVNLQSLGGNKYSYPPSYRPRLYATPTARRCFLIVKHAIACPPISLDKHSCMQAVQRNAKRCTQRHVCTCLAGSNIIQRSFLAKKSMQMQSGSRCHSKTMSIHFPRSDHLHSE